MLSPNNSRPPDLLLPESTTTSKTSISNNNNKREQETVDKVCKMVKLSQPDEHHEKENVDPKKLMTAATTVSIFIYSLWSHICGKNSSSQENHFFLLTINGTKQIKCTHLAAKICQFSIASVLAMLSNDW